MEVTSEKNKDHLTIHKLRNNIPVTKKIQSVENMLLQKVAGTKDQFIEQYGKAIGCIYKSVTGVDQTVLNQAFADFLQTGNLRESNDFYKHYYFLFIKKRDH